MTWTVTKEQLMQTAEKRYPGVTAHWDEIYEPVMGIVLEGATDKQAKDFHKHLVQLRDQNLLPERWSPNLGKMRGPSLSPLDGHKMFAPASQRSWDEYDLHPAIALVYVGY